MLSAWPSLFDFWLLAPVLLRIVLGGELIILFHDRYRSLTGALGLLSGALIVVGFRMQPAAVLSLIILLPELWKNRENRLAVTALIVIALSLLLLGPGLFAFDLPL